MSVDHDTANVKSRTRTRDAFLGGRLHILQPASGFRAGSDSVLLGASVTVGTGKLLDMGCGAGTAGLTALVRHPELTATLVDYNAEMLEFARQNLIENDIANRAEIVEADVTAPGARREAKGLKRDHYSVVIANPPFFDSGVGTTAPDASRAAARHMGAEMLDLWVRTAAASAAPGGEIIFIFSAAGLTPLLSAFEARFGGLCLLPLLSRPGDEASRVLLRATKGSRAPLRILPPLNLHGEQGNAFSPEVDEVLRGKSPLVW